MEKLFVEDSGGYKEASDKDILMVASFAAKRQLSPGVKITGEKSAKKFLIPLLAAKDYEVFCVAFLNADQSLIAFEEIFRGTIDQTPAYPREVFKRALELNSAGIILVHNHPTGSPEPSDADIMTTLRMKVVGDALKVLVLEHFIVTKTEVRGLIEEGDLNPGKMMELMMEQMGMEKHEKVHTIEIDGSDMKGGLAKLMEKIENEIGLRKSKGGKKSLN